MTSAGSIPVRRNPNDHSRGDRKGDDSSDSRLALFEATFRAFDADEVIGVFPEGTSYTEPQIVQVKEGAAWVALEYARWQTQQDTDHTHGERRKLVVIPVGIVYSDKSHFQSRVSGRLEPMSENDLQVSWCDTDLCAVRGAYRSRAIYQTSS